MPLIIFRYLSKQVLQVMVAITLVVLLIIMSGRFVNYVAQAATGSLKPEFLFAIMGLRIPEFLVMIMPLGLFLGILLAYGRLHIENEMTVLTAGGLSRSSLLRMTMMPAGLVMLIVMFLSLWASPMGIRQVELIFAKQATMSQFDLLVPGRFQKMGGRVTYTHSLSDENQQMNGVFIADQNVSGSIGLSMVLADSARMQSKTNETGYRYLILTEGRRYDLTPGKLPIREVHFGNYGIRMEDRKVNENITREKAMPTTALFGSSNLKYQAELQWRFALPILIPIIVLIALPLSHVNPRQGRYVKMFPAILLYLLYLSLLMSARGAIEDGAIPVEVGLWPVHGVFLLLALALYFNEPARLMLARRRSKRA